MINFQIDGIEYRTYDDLFAVSRCGKVLRKLMPYEPRDYRNDKYLVLGRKRLMHRVVATCWIENPNNAKHVHHINGIKHDNRAENLEWLTPKEHSSHHDKKGGYIRTEATRQKFRDYRTGRKDSEETRLKKAKSLAENCPKRQCKFYGVTYPSVAAGARVANLHPSSFRLRCLSKNFPDYELSWLSLLDLS